MDERKTWCQVETPNIGGMRRMVAEAVGGNGCRRLYLRVELPGRPTQEVLLGREEVRALVRDGAVWLAWCEGQDATDRIAWEQRGAEYPPDVARRRAEAQAAQEAA